MTVEKLGVGTRAVHGGRKDYPSEVRRIAPCLGSLAQAEKRFSSMTGDPYARGGHAVTRELEERFVVLAGGKAAVAVASGQAASVLPLQVLARGRGDIIASNHLFGGTFAVLKDMEADAGKSVHWADPADPASFDAAIRAAKDPRAVFVESISNPDNVVAELEGIAAVAAAHKLPFIVDNTLGLTLCDPFRHGADVVVYSATKLAVGHNNLLTGLVVDGGTFAWKDSRFALLNAVPPNGMSLEQEFGPVALAAGVRKLMVLYGASPSLADCATVVENLLSAPLRIARQVENAGVVAKFLAGHKAVGLVQYPGFDGDAANTARAAKYFPKGAGVVVTFNIKGGRGAVASFLERLRVIAHRANVGQLESIVTIPAGTTHRQFGPVEKALAKMDEGTVRFSVGIEDAGDLVADLDGALG